jgi:hypothetical protein
MANQCKAIRSAPQRVEHVDSAVGLRTEYLGPGEMVVAAEVVFGPRQEFATAADAIRSAEARVRETVNLQTSPRAQARTSSTPMPRRASTAAPS